MLRLCESAHAFFTPVSVIWDRQTPLVWNNEAWLASLAAAASRLDESSSPESTPSSVAGRRRTTCQSNDARCDTPGTISLILGLLQLGEANDCGKMTAPLLCSAQGTHYDSKASDRSHIETGIAPATKIR